MQSADFTSSPMSVSPCNWSFYRNSLHFCKCHQHKGAFNQLCHHFHQNHTPSKPAELSYKRLSAQEVCYQRMQMAQQQAAQLSAATRTAESPKSSSPGFSGEKKRIAHRPNPRITSPTTSKKASNQHHYLQLLCLLLLRYFRYSLLLC